MSRAFARALLLFVCVCRIGLAYQVELKDIRQNRSEITITATPEDLTFQSIDTNGISFLKVNQGESFNQDRIGTPDLPVIHRWIASDDEASFVPSVTYEGETTLDNVVAYPVQPITLDNGQKLPFAYRKETYGANALEEVPVRIGAKAKLGNVTVIPISVSPVKYDAVQKKLTVFSKVKVALDWKSRGNTKFKTTQFVARQAAALTLNGADAFDAAKKAKMLVLAPAALAAQAKQFGEVVKGAEGTAITYAEALAGAKAEDLQKLILSQHRATPFDMVLLFGDAKMIPLYVKGGNPGDAFYSLLNGSDDIADVGLGRLPVSDAAEAKAIIEKVKKYRQLYAKGHRESKVMLIAHNEEYPKKYTENMENLRKIPNAKNFDFVLQYGGDKATNESVVDAQSKGFSIINYRGHGDNEVWYEWSKDNKDFTFGHVDQFSDKDYDMAFIFNVCCNSGNIEHASGGLVKKQLFPGSKSSFRGAIGVLGSTRPSYTEVNHRFDLHLFTYIQKTASPRIGEIYAYANNKLVQENGGTAPENVNMYLLLSDPTLIPWI